MRKISLFFLSFKEHILSIVSLNLLFKSDGLSVDNPLSFEIEKQENLDIISPQRNVDYKILMSIRNIKKC